MNGENQPGAVNIQVKPGQTVAYVDMQTWGMCVAEVLGPAGKATGQKINWRNLRYSAPNVMKGAEASVDFSKVNEFKFVNDASCVDFNSREENMIAFEDVSFGTAKSA